MEFFIAFIIFAAAIIILYKNIKKKSSGQCDCTDCTNHCSNYKKTNK